MIIEYSLIMAVLLFNLAMIVIAILRRRTGFLTKYSTTALVLLAVFGALRIVLPFSFPFTYVVNSFVAIPKIESLLSFDVWPGASRIELHNMVFLIWAVGSLFMLLRTMRNILSEALYRQRYRVVKDEQAERLARELRLKHSRIIISPDVVVPYVTGFFKAKIYLPGIEMEDDVLKLILKHECQHFKSLDSYIKAFYTLLSIVFWWNPIVHIFLRELDRLLEIRCDEAVTNHMSEGEKTQYLESLLFIAKHIHTKTTTLARVSAYVQSEQHGFMEQRFSLISKGGSNNSSIKQVVSVVLVVVVFMASFMIIIQPAYLPTKNDLGGVFELDPENAHILFTHEGKYELYIDGLLLLELEEDLIKMEDFKNIPFIMED